MIHLSRHGEHFLRISCQSSIPAWAPFPGPTPFIQEGVGKSGGMNQVYSGSMREINLMSQFAKTGRILKPQTREVPPPSPLAGEERRALRMGREPPPASSQGWSWNSGLPGDELAFPKNWSGSLNVEWLHLAVAEQTSVFLSSVSVLQMDCMPAKKEKNEINILPCY